MAEQERRFDDVCAWTDSCALAGAMAFFAAWQDAAVIVNGPMWCYFYAMRTLEQECPMIAQRMISTQLDNDAIVFGAEEYIRETLAPHLDPPPALLAVENSCAAGLIGDDVRSIARGMGFPRVAAFDSGGLPKSRPRLYGGDRLPEGGADARTRQPPRADARLSARGE